MHPTVQHFFKVAMGAEEPVNPKTQGSHTGPRIGKLLIRGSDSPLNSMSDFLKNIELSNQNEVHRRILAVKDTESITHSRRC